MRATSSDDDHVSGPADPAQAPHPDGPSATELTTRRVIDTAVDCFAHTFYGEVRLDDIARKADISKRMIHYHFTDKKGLYQDAVVEALTRTQPDPAELEIDSSIPVDGVRRVIEAVFRRFLDHPEAVGVLRMENAQRILDLDEMPPLIARFDVIQRLDKLLMLGQDAGTFRPGISALDVYFLLISLCSMRQHTGHLMRNLFSIDPTDPENTQGVLRMAIDAVLAFITAIIPDTGAASYLRPAEAPAAPPAAAQQVYADLDSTSAGIYG